MAVFYPEEIKKNIKLFSIIGIGLIIPNYYTNYKRYQEGVHSSNVNRLSKVNAYLSNDFLRFPNDYIAFIILGGVIIPFLKYNWGWSYKVLFGISILGAIIILTPDFVNRIDKDGTLMWPNSGLLTM